MDFVANRNHSTWNFASKRPTGTCVARFLYHSWVTCSCSFYVSFLVVMWSRITWLCHETGISMQARDFTYT